MTSHTWNTWSGPLPLCCFVLFFMCGKIMAISWVSLDVMLSSNLTYGQEHIFCPIRKGMWNLVRGFWRHSELRGFRQYWSMLHWLTVLHHAHRALCILSHQQWTLLQPCTQGLVHAVIAAMNTSIGSDLRLLHNFRNHLISLFSTNLHLDCSSFPSTFLFLYNHYDLLQEIKTNIFLWLFLSM